MQASSSGDEIHPALAACTSLDSVELYDVDLDGGSGAVAPATSASSLSPTLRSAHGAHRSTSSPLVAAMTGTSTSIDVDNRDEYLEPASTRPQHEDQHHHMQQPPSSMKAPHKRTSSSYNLISPALEKVPSSDSATLTTVTSSESMSTSSSSSMLSAMDNDEEEGSIHVHAFRCERKVKTEETNDHGVYHFKVSKVASHIGARRVDYVPTQAPAQLPEEDPAPSKAQLDSIDEATKEASQITTVSTRPGPDDNFERAASGDQRGVYRFKVQVDESQLRKAEWWQFW